MSQNIIEYYCEYYTMEEKDIRKILSMIILQEEENRIIDYITNSGEMAIWEANEFIRRIKHQLNI